MLYSSYIQNIEVRIELLIYNLMNFLNEIVHTRVIKIWTPCVCEGIYIAACTKIESPSFCSIPVSRTIIVGQLTLEFDFILTLQRPEFMKQGR